MIQCVSQDFETGCLKLAVVKSWGFQIFKGSHDLLIFQPQIRHDVIKQCHGNYKEMKKLNYKLEIEIFRNFLFKGLGVQKGTQTPSWLRPCYDRQRFYCPIIS